MLDAFYFPFNQDAEDFERSWLLLADIFIQVGLTTRHQQHHTTFSFLINRTVLETFSTR